MQNIYLIEKSEGDERACGLNSKGNEVKGWRRLIVRFVRSFIESLELKQRSSITSMTNRMVKMIMVLYRLVHDLVQPRTDSKLNWSMVQTKPILFSH